MITVALEPSELQSGRKNELVVHLTNHGREEYTNLVLKLRLPDAIVLLEGSERIEIDRLLPGTSISQKLLVYPKASGTWTITSSNFSYRDSSGRSSGSRHFEHPLPVVQSDAEPIFESLANGAPPVAEPSFSSPAQRLHVFLCYSSGDRPGVMKIYHRLKAVGIDPWLDVENLLPGQDWHLEIRKAVRRADAVLVCLSSGSVGKAGYVQRELRHVLDVADEQPEGEIYLIPVRLEACSVPSRLSHLQWVDLYQDGGWDRLMKVLNMQAAKIRARPT